MRILFLHHGDHRGGAPLSMLYTMKEIRNRGYDPIVGLAIPTPELRTLYNDQNIKTIDMPWIKMIYFWSANPMQWWKLSTYSTVARASYKQKEAESLTKQVIDKYKIDIIHLNSVSLFTIVPYLLKTNFPFVWHIREHAPKSGSLIFNRIVSLMKKTANLIFLSEAEQISWLGNKDNGTVVYNFVSQEKFDFSMDVSDLRNRLKISSDDRVVLYLGGLKPHKGINVLIEALNKLKTQYPNIKCIMPDSVIYSTKRAGWRRLIKRIIRKKNFEDLMIEKIEKFNMQNICIRLPFDADAQKYFAISELVIFPAVTPHFARPAIEAAMMKKPVIVSDWAVLLEVVKPNVTGLVVAPNDVNDLVVKIDVLLSDKKLRDKLAENAYAYALNNFTAGAQIGKVINMYKSYV